MLIKRLERLAEIVEKKREEKKNELTKIEELLKSVENDIEQTKNEYEKSYQRLLYGPVTGSDFYAIKDYLSYLRERENLLLQKKHELTTKAAKLKDELVSLHKECKKLEILIEKAISNKRKHELRLIQKRIDEIALRSKVSSD
ncbi:MAG: flagellar FliJ family protein [Desulfobacterota bacterium]|nr:flagellar FliJ family protein [Thermodesulfobacteriota bacterium]MDW8002797.1 flagellar FliJ family protein [Deltaproteobacteria bacterium]